MAYMTDVSTEDLQAFKAAFFRALAHPVRIRILELLVRGERSAHGRKVYLHSMIAEAAGEI